MLQYDTQPNADECLAPLVVAPRDACRMLSIGLTRLYELKDGELESYRDGGSRRITVSSIHAYVTRRLNPT
jgi:excisionase family DNA binding protein